MKVLGITGWSGCGKTTLIVALIPRLRALGLAVSTLKHAHHDVDLDTPGKDTFRHREAGAHEVILATGRRWALLRELRDEPEPALPELLARLQPVDLVLVEGYKRDRHPKVEAWRAEAGLGLIATDDPTIRAVASDRPLPDLRVPRFDLDDTRAIADFILGEVGL